MRRMAVSIAAVTALTGVAACGSGGSGDKEAKGGSALSPVAALRLADKSTSGADSARVESTTTMGTMMSMKADGVLDWADGYTGTMTIEYTGGAMADQMRQLGSTSMEARYLPDAYYANMGDAFARQTGGKQWIKYDYDALADMAGGSGAYMKDQMQNTTPNQSVKLLLASGDVQKVGEETVRGQRTTHYSGAVEVADLASKSSGLTASQLADLKKQLEQAGITTETIDIWINEDDLLVKKVEKGEMTSGTLSQTAFYTDYGVEVSAEEPPADDTVDFKELVQTQPSA
ncbi:putative lipoprotein [Streptomyces poonensis]|uniref:Lipoprotein n=1 Tax=Streptomyces poonensis TaxID=68255 RepID=A0A918PP39_9ACTN|nr:putative lipoprotein [Streptomyces poonensis]GLJ90873.1 putative lipoprotein [Streptomyces poonensis]